MTRQPIALFFKSHIDTFTRKDGAIVAAHDDKRTPLLAVGHPNGKHQPGDHVFFPHPKKPGKNGLGKYKGQRGGKSVIEHEGAEHEVAHDDVKPARGIAKPARREDVITASPEFQRWKQAKSD